MPWCHVALQEHRAEIDARAPTFDTFDSFGNQLLNSDHYESDDIKDKMDELAADREGTWDVVWTAFIYCSC